MRTLFFCKLHAVFNVQTIGSTHALSPLHTVHCTLCTRTHTLYTLRTVDSAHRTLRTRTHTKTPCTCTNSGRHHKCAEGAGSNALVNCGWLG